VAERLGVDAGEGVPDLGVAGEALLLGRLEVRGCGRPGLGEGLAALDGAERDAREGVVDEISWSSISTPLPSSTATSAR